MSDIILPRRGFLTACLALAVAPAIVKASSLMPVRSIVPFLWGDGIHDDTAALQALLDRGGIVELEGRVYQISNTLVVRRPNTIIQNAKLFFDRPFDGAAIKIHSSAAPASWGGYFEVA